MKDLDKKLKEVARIHVGLKDGFDYDEELYYDSSRIKQYETFITAVKSDIAKEYWRDGMFTESDVIKFIEDFGSYADRKLEHDENPNLRQWFEQNKKKS